MNVTTHPNVRTVIEEEGLNGEVTESEQIIREKLTHVLSIYPRLSPSMLQVGIGTSLPPSLWKPVLQQMIKEGLIRQEQYSAKTPTDRVQVYTVLSLIIPNS